MRGDIALFLGFIGIVGGAIIITVLLVFRSGEDPPGACEDPLPPLGTSNISQRGFLEQDLGMTRVVEAAAAGDLRTAQDEFFGDVHNFAHNVDPEIRKHDEELGKLLCQSVIALEEEFAFSEDPDNIALEAIRVREILRDAAVLLGYERPGDTP